MDPAPQAAHSSAVEPNPGLTSKEACESGPLDPYPVVGSSPRAPEPAEPGWAPVMEFTAADIFQRSPFGDVLNSLKSLSLSGIRCPLTTHFIATIEDLTDVLDFDSEDIDSMDKMKEKLQNPWGAGLLPGHTIYTW